MFYYVGDVCVTLDPGPLYGDWRKKGRRCVVMEVSSGGRVVVRFDDGDGWGGGKWGMPCCGLELYDKTEYEEDF